MTKQEALTLIGLLTFNGVYCQNEPNAKTFNELDSMQKYEFLDYLENLKMPFELAYDLLDGFYYTFYHNHGKPIRNKKIQDTSEFDYACIDTDKIRVGIWCEVDGFIAWLDQHETHWFVKPKEQVLKEEEEARREFEKRYGRKIRECFDKVYAKEKLSAPSVNFNLGSMQVRVARIMSPVLQEYKRGKKRARKSKKISGGLNE